MFGTYVAGVLVRDLKTVKRELLAYEDERDIWVLPPGIANSAGTLALHLAGNVQHFVGAVLGKSGYVRNRDAEFSRRDVPRAELLRDLDAAIEVADRTLPALPSEALESAFPVPLGKTTVNGADFLIHVAAHLAYHLGQVDYHRRLVTGKNTTVAAQAIPELRSARSQQPGASS